jgi:uncharacterized membrane protein
MVDLGTLGGTFSTAVAVNAPGQAIGLSTTAGEAEQPATLGSDERSGVTSR